MNLDIANIAATHNLKRRSGGFAGPCPKCGGGATSDKFVIKDDGGFKCYSCDFKGDAITWLREIDGKSCPDAHEAAGTDCRAAGCPARGTCRLGDGTGTRPRRQARSVAPAPLRQPAQLAATVSRAPDDLWLHWATALADGARQDLQAQPEQLAWLAARGLDAVAVARFGLGWLHHDRRVLRISIGLAPKDGKDKLWVPGGLVIPIYAEATLVRLRIRRTQEAQAKFLPDRKYMWIEGSGTAPLVIHPTATPSRGTVIVEAELDAMAIASAHPGVTVIALGTVAGGMPDLLRRQCSLAPVILVALDADPGKDGKRGAGPTAIASWSATYRQAKFWPVPAGKDPGDYVRDHQGCLRAWIEAGLPPMVASITPATPVSAAVPPIAPPIPPACHDLPLSLDAGQRGVGGERVSVDCQEAPESATTSPMAAFIALLATETGWIWCDEYDTSIRYKLPYPPSIDALQRRTQISQTVYGAGPVATLLELLPPGTYGAGSLSQFFKGA